MAPFPSLLLAIMSAQSPSLVALPVHAVDVASSTAEAIHMHALAAFSAAAQQPVPLTLPGAPCLTWQCLHAQREGHKFENALVVQVVGPAPTRPVASVEVMVLDVPAQRLVARATQPVAGAEMVSWLEAAAGAAQGAAQQAVGHLQAAQKRMNNPFASSMRSVALAGTVWQAPLPMGQALVHVAWTSASALLGFAASALLGLLAVQQAVEFSRSDDREAQVLLLPLALGLLAVSDGGGSFRDYPLFFAVLSGCGSLTCLGIAGVFGSLSALVVTRLVAGRHVLRQATDDETPLPHLVVPEGT